MYWNLRLYRLPTRLRRSIEARTNARIITRTLEWCRKQSDIAIQSLHPKVVLSIELPRTIEPTLAPEFESHMRYAVEEKYVARMKHTRLIGRDGLVILADGNFAAEVGNGEAGVK